MIIVQTPLRISFSGGGTDLASFYSLEEGCVLSTAIDKYVFVIVNERFDDRIYVNYTRKEIVDDYEDLEHELVREAMRISGVHRGVEITMLADIPSEGSGLGSSSSITVGLLNALFQFRGVQMPAHDLAEMACEIEIERCGKPIGKQDQYIAAYGGLHQFAFGTDGTVVAERVDLPPAELRRFASNVMLFFTDVTRKSSSILTAQSANTLNRIDQLRHIKSFVPKARDALLAGEFDRIGRYLHENWTYKKQLANNVSNPDIDGMYDRALAAGAIGGKVAGAGGGGFLLLYVPLAQQDAVRESLSGFRELPFMLERDGTKSIFNLRRQSTR